MHNDFLAQARKHRVLGQEAKNREGVYEAKVRRRMRDYRYRPTNPPPPPFPSSRLPFRPVCLYSSYSAVYGVVDDNLD